MKEKLDNCSVHVIGLGLMGGSLAMALRGKVSRLTAADIKPDVLDLALKQRVIDAAGDEREADIVVIAIPADRIIQLLPLLRLKSGSLVIDLASTKRAVCEGLDRLPAGVMSVGGHPMCGRAENGFRHASSELYIGSQFVLCETRRTTGSAIVLAEALVEALGAIPRWIDRSEHDAVTAVTSHLPHLLNFALMRLALESDTPDGTLRALTAGGFDGATRLARTDASMAAGILATNSDQLREATARLRTHIEYLDALFEEPETLQDELASIVTARRAWR
jgi:prephenate dehydrogenase